MMASSLESKLCSAFEALQVVRCAEVSAVDSLPAEGESSLAGSDEFDCHDDCEYADEEEEEIVEMTEQEALAMLDAVQPPLNVCSQLFLHSADAPIPPLTLLPEYAVRSLRNDGFVVIDDLAIPDMASLLRTDALKLFASNAFSAPPMHAGFTDASARTDVIMWVHPAKIAHSLETPSPTPGIEAAIAFIHRLRDDAAQVIALRRGEAEFQLAIYPAGTSIAGSTGGAHYKRHRDALPDDGSASDQRRLTLVLYACDAAWNVDTDGGGLAVYPPSGGPAAVIAPLPGRVVAFLSGAVDHEVLPCTGGLAAAALGRHRVALTAWLQ